jgi:hypothetical protein
VCVPAAPGPEFKQCISYPVDSSASRCPPEFPERSVFYQSVTDDRSCPVCTCAAPSGSTCTGSVSIFGDAACGAPLPLSIPIDAINAKCHDLPQGSALGSKSASAPTFTPGQCAPQFDATKTTFASPDGVLVWCCQGTP